MWPEPVREQCTERTNHDDSQPLTSAMRSHRPSTVLEMFWSTSKRGSQYTSVRGSSERPFSAGYATTAASQREVSAI
jgi:hypothetical protein